MHRKTVLARIFLYPAQAQHGVSHTLCDTTDIASTILGVCGVEVPETMHGIHLERGQSRDFVYSEGQYGTNAAPCIGYMVRTTRYKLLTMGSAAHCALYDLEQDPCETHDVSSLPEYAEILAQHKAMLANAVLYRDTSRTHLDMAAAQRCTPEVLLPRAEKLRAFITEQIDKL